MRIAVLAASGPTGRQLAIQALERDHDVIALARTPSRLDLPDNPRLTRVAADVLDQESVVRGVAGADVVVSGLGITKGDAAGTLIAGARALVEARPKRIVWLGAIGTGRSTRRGGRLYELMLNALLRGEVREKADADEIILAAGGTVVHAGPLTNGVVSSSRRSLALERAPRRFAFPPLVSRGTVAAAMLDEAERPAHAGSVLVPLN